MGKSVHLPTHMFLTKIATQFLIECYNVFSQGNFTLVCTDSINL